MKLSEKEFNELVKNKKVKIADSFGKNEGNKIVLMDDKQKTTKKQKITLLEEEQEDIKKNKAKGVKTSDINKSNRNSIVEFSCSDDHVSIVFNGAKLLSVNQIFAILQYRKYEIFTYKKVWHEIVGKILNDQALILRSENKTLPFFNEAVEITLFRQASRLVDEDAMSTMFKYVIDGLKRDDEKNPNGILAEDNPKIVHRIVCYSEKGEHIVGIKIKKIKEKKEQITAKDILKK